MVSGRRDGAFGVSMVVPTRARKSFESADEFEAVQWTDAQSLISYYYYPLRMSGSTSYDHPGVGQCLLRVNGKRVLVERYDRMGKHGLFANFEMSSVRDSGFGMTIFGTDRGSVCTLAARTMWSVVFGDNSVQALTILDISRDAASFIYEDAHGTVTRAKVGDRLPDGTSTVRAISAMSVTVRAFEPDGTGGLKAVDHVMNSVRAWTILDIASEASSFHYKDAFGTKMTARVGDKLPDEAIVRAISPESVTVRVLEQDGSGGWKQVDRVLRAAKPSER